MARRVKLYMFTGSTPSLTARLMLEHEGIDFKCVHVMVGPHAFGMLGRGFQTMTVPALKIEGRRVQGSRDISRVLDELVERPPLFPADPERRRQVEDAERRGEELQDAVRRIFWCAARRDPAAFRSVLRHPNPLMRAAQRLSRRFVTRLATAGHRATDRAGEEDDIERGTPSLKASPPSGCVGPVGHEARHLVPMDANARVAHEPGARHRVEHAEAVQQDLDARVKGLSGALAGEALALHDLHT